MAVDLQPLFTRLIDLLQAEFGADLLGVLVAGSYIYGTPTATSDLDTHVLIDRPQRRRRNILLDGLEIEMFINPPFRIAGYFDERGVTTHMFAFGRAIFDPQGIVARLQMQARMVWERGPQPIAKRDEWLHRYRPADWLRDLDDIGDSDSATATLLIVTIVEQLLATHYQQHGRWPAKLKRRLADLAAWDAQAADLVRRALTDVAFDERRRAVAQLADHVLAPFGGLAAAEWTMEWEPLEPPQEGTDDSIST